MLLLIIFVRTYYSDNESIITTVKLNNDSIPSVHMEAKDHSVVIEHFLMPFLPESGDILPLLNPLESDEVRSCSVYVLF